MKNTWIIVLVVGVSVVGYLLSQQFHQQSTDTKQNVFSKDIDQPKDNSVSQLKRENTLDLIGKDLNTIPLDVFDRTDLVELDVSHNSIKGALQAEIRQLKNLKVLNVSNNQMTGVPAEIGQLENLEILDLSNNQITGLPLELGNLKKIRTINLSGNNYSKYDLDLIQAKLPRVKFILN